MQLCLIEEETSFFNFSNIWTICNLIWCNISKRIFICFCNNISSYIEWLQKIKVIVPVFVTKRTVPVCKVDVGGYGIIWNDDIDISCDELFENGKQVKTPFDELMAFSDATLIWGLNESTLRKAIAYGKLVNAVDVKGQFLIVWV